MKHLVQLAVLSLVIFTAVSCGSNSTSSNAVTEGILKVTTSTTGNIGINNYFVDIIAINKRVHIGIDTTIFIHGLDEGFRAVKLVDVPKNCSIKGLNPRRFHITAGDTTVTTFEVKCDSTSM